ncbi:MAG TPA: hypothetical protein VKU40_05355 [Thermoanaerobaculia bacterium]|nr:hypothetical protein [Thermoanaerobaculia bacterium]
MSSYPLHRRSTGTVLVLLAVFLLCSAPPAAADPVTWFSPDAGAAGGPPEAAVPPSDGTDLQALTAPLLPAELGSSPSLMLSLGEVTLFSADDGTGRCLWRTDGSAAGTYPLLDGEVCLLPLAAASEDGTGAFLIGTVGGFSSAAWEIWHTDGTLAGTRTLTHFANYPGEYGFPIFHTSLVTLGDDRAFFIAWDAARGFEPWVSDGTPQGTRPLGDLVSPGANGVNGFRMARIGDELALVLRPWGDVWEVWRSDGTAAGTHRVSTLPWTLDQGGPGQLYGLGERAVFLRIAPECSVESAADVWTTDGTAAGTGKLAGSIRCLQTAAQPFLADGRAFWAQEQPDGSFELLATDGSAAGTRLVTDFAAAHPFGPHFPLNPRPALYGGKLYLPADGGDGAGQEIWRVDPQTRATVRHADLCPGGCSSSVFFVGEMAGKLLFTADDGAHGTELWQMSTPGAAPGLVADLCPGTCASSPAIFLRVAAPTAANELWFGALPSGGAPYELFRLGPSGAPRQLTDLAAGGGGIFSFLAGDATASRIVFSASDGASGDELWATDGTTAGTTMLADLAYGPEACLTDASASCLGAGGRFVVRVLYRDHHNGGEGKGLSLPAAGSNRSAFFWFFRPDNVELVVKVLDGTPVNGAYWTFYGALSDVEYWVVVEDRERGVRRIYHNPPGELCGLGDTQSMPVFAGSTATAAEPAFGLLGLDAATAGSHPTEPCVADAETLCLLDGRFQVRVAWQDQHNGGSGVGGALPFADRSGFFWFFRPDNVELVVKVLDGTPVNGKIWVFYGALSDVGYEVEVTDMQDGHTVRKYVNTPGNLCGNADNSAF